MAHGARLISIEITQQAVSPGYAVKVKAPLDYYSRDIPAIIGLSCNCFFRVSDFE
jgi:hypothetical protein